ncbi:hypothetical protein [Brachybacterium sp. NPDC056505]|jgi:hypothetical protein|uniref:hypothetical protein n=1 Tax=Brachybacterium sp. NPDC056505 TaxID=3345843 RepID=UPI00366B63C1
MDIRTRIEIEGLERRATVRERQADEHEDAAPLNHGFGTARYMSAFDTAEKYRAEARELREKAARLRARSA